MKEEVTVIVPAYNSGKVIEKCIRSLRNQTVVPHVIVINDGSSDETEIKLKKYKNVDNFLIINQKNQGVSAARNRGIKECKTKYVTFVDPDDHVDRTFIATLLEGFTLAKNVEMSVCNFQGDVNGSLMKKHEFGNGVVDNYKAISELFLSNSISGSVCNKMFNIDNIREQNIKFDETLSISEDFIFCFDYLKKCQGEVVLNNSVHYYYHVGNNGLSSNVRLGVKSKALTPKQTKLFLSFLDEPIVKGNRDLENNIRSLVTITSVDFLRKLPLNDKKNKIFLVTVIKENIGCLLVNKQFNVKEKIKAILALRFRLTLSIYDLLKWRILNHS